MGTRNFFKTNAKNYYVVLDNVEDDFDLDFEVEDLRDNIITKLAAKGYNAAPMNEWDGRRNFEGKYIARVYVEVSNEAEIVANIVIRNGYYEAANLDFELETEIYDSLSVEDEGLAESKNLVDTIEKISNQLRDDIDEVFTQVSTPYVCTAVFSNGEAIYSKIKQ